MEAGHCGFNNEHIEILCGFRTGSKITFVFYNVLMGVIRLRYNCAGKSFLFGLNEQENM